MAPKLQPIKHGTIYAYKARGCRCKTCRRANADACREYARSRGAGPLGQPCEASGKRYSSQADAARDLRVSASTITYHLNLHGHLDNIGGRRGGKAPRRCRPVRVGLRVWESQAALERYLGVTTGRVHDWLRRGQQDRLIAALMRADAKTERRAA